jgi:hypothetical protein
MRTLISIRINASTRPRLIRSTGIVFCIIVALLEQSASAQVVGVVTVSDGDNHLIRGNGYYEVEPGIDVEEGDVFQTRDASTVQAEMSDGTILEVGPASEFYISEYQLRNDESVEVAAVSLVQGWLRFVAAKLRPSSRYEINTSVATIGIRGTEGVVSADEETSSLLLNEGEVEFAELNEAGELGVKGLVKPGEFVRRDRGRRFAKRLTAPAAFLGAMPGRFKARPKRFKSTLLRQGVKPKFVRSAGKKDIERLLRSNPRGGKKLNARFGESEPKIQRNRSSGAIKKKNDSSNKKSGGKQNKPKRKGSGSKR